MYVNMCVIAINQHLNRGQVFRISHRQRRMLDTYLWCERKGKWLSEWA